MRIVHKYFGIFVKCQGQPPTGLTGYAGRPAWNLSIPNYRCLVPIPIMKLPNGSLKLLAARSLGYFREKIEGKISLERKGKNKKLVMLDTILDTKRCIRDRWETSRAKSYVARLSSSIFRIRPFGS